MATNGHRGIPALEFFQNDHRLFVTVMDARTLATYGRILRWGQEIDGVNRQFDKNHALDIAVWMTENPNALMEESVCGDLQGAWRFEHGELVPLGDDSIFCVDDGQHRFFALTEIMDEEDRARWSFPIVASMGLDYETRLRLFMQQGKRKKIDTKLTLAQRHHLNAWENDIQRDAYELLIWLNSQANSPLRGKIILEETVTRTYENQHRPQGISAAGLHNTLISVMGKHSPLFGLPMDRRVQVCRDMIRLAQETWPNYWESENHILTTARGINAILKLMVSGTNFRGTIGDDFNVITLRKAFGYAKGFKWHKDSLRNHSVREITDALDRAVMAGRQRSLRPAPAAAAA